MAIPNPSMLMSKFLPTEQQINSARMSVRLRKVRKVEEILVVDRLPIAQELIKNTLNSKYKVTLAKTAREAWLNYLNFTPDLVFMETDLPDLSGHKLAQMIDLIDPESYMVMVANDENDAAIFAKKYGKNGFITKPYDTEKILGSFKYFQTRTQRKRLRLSQYLFHQRG